MNGARRKAPSPDEMRQAHLAEVRAVYADLAARSFDRDCVLRAGCCHFKQTGLTPYLTRGEALLAALAVRAGGRTRLPPSPSGACPLWQPETARCLIYESRPLGCRTHFCAAAGGPLPRRDVLDLIRRLETVDVSLGGDGPHPLPLAVTQALAKL